MAGSTTRFVNGCVNADKTSPYGSFVLPSPSSCHTFFDDFDAYSSGDWDSTTIGTGTISISNGDGGIITLQNSAAAFDGIVFNQKKEAFSLEIGKKSWFECRIKTDTTDCSCYCGAVNSGSSLTIVSGVYFVFIDSAVGFVVQNNNSVIGGATLSIPDLTEYTSLSFYFDGVSGFYVYVNGEYQTTVSTTLFPTETLCAGSVVYNNVDAASSMLIDYVFLSKER